MASLSNPAQVFDYSVTLAGTAITACPYNANRSFLMIQLASGTGAVFSFTNPTPVTGSAGCYNLGTGQPPLLFSPVVPNSALYLGAGTGQVTVSQG